MSVLWVTGLSGSGKTTSSKELIKQSQHLKWIHLDGDALRAIFLLVQTYDKASMLSLATRYSKLAMFLTSQGHNVIVSTISLFQEIHAWNRRNIENYFEIFIDAEISILRDRDDRTIYSSTTGTDVVGVKIDYDFPVSSDYVIKQNFEQLELKNHVENVISKIDWLK
jgi:cytidine diphosphoramidate kinase